MITWFKRAISADMQAEVKDPALLMTINTDSEDGNTPYPRFRVFGEAPHKSPWYKLLLKNAKQRKPDKNKILQVAKYVFPSLLVFIMLLIFWEQRSTIKDHSITVEKLATGAVLAAIATEDEDLQETTTTEKLQEEERSEYEKFTVRMQKWSASEEESKRYYYENQKYWKLRNNQSNGVVEFGETPFADESRKNLTKLLNQKKIMSDLTLKKCPVINLRRIPKRNLPAMHPEDIFDQGFKCNAAYAYATLNSAFLDGFFPSDLVFGKGMGDLSVQSLICDKYNHGCRGGSIAEAMTSLRTHYIATRYELPYTEDDTSCTARSGVPRKGAEGLPQAIEPCRISQNSTSAAYNEIIKILASNRSVIAEIYIDYDIFFYKSGVYERPAESVGSIAVLLTGYAEDEHGAHLIGQNSWGSRWGESGFFKIRPDCLVLDELYAWHKKEEAAVAPSNEAPAPETVQQAMLEWEKAARLQYHDLPSTYFQSSTTAVPTVLPWYKAKQRPKTYVRWTYGK